MNELKRLIDEFKQPNVSDWVYDVECWLNDNGKNTKETKQLIDGIKFQGDAFRRCDNLLSLLKQIYKKSYEKINTPRVDENQSKCFVAMMFSEKQEQIYENCISPAVKQCGLEPLKINDKSFIGPIMDEIEREISSSLYLIADLTGNRGGVYYEAGIARGLMLCNHKIKLILTCSRECFESEKVHFDVQQNKIIIYDNEEVYKKQLIQILDTLNKERGEKKGAIFSFE